MKRCQLVGCVSRWRSGSRCCGIVGRASVKRPELWEPETEERDKEGSGVVQ